RRPARIDTAVAQLQAPDAQVRAATEVDERAARIQESAGWIDKDRRDRAVRRRLPFRVQVAAGVDARKAVALLAVDVGERAGDVYISIRADGKRADAAVAVIDRSGSGQRESRHVGACAGRVYVLHAAWRGDVQLSAIWTGRERDHLHCSVR